MPYTAALAETSAPGCTSPALYRQRVKCLRNGITDLTRDRPKGVKEILGWGRAKHHRKRQTGTFGRWTPTPGQYFPKGKNGESVVLLYPEGWSMYLGLEEPVQPLIPAPPGWSKPCSEGNDLTVLLSFSPGAREAARSRVAL